MIVKMSKLSIVGLMDERSAIVRRLMKLGVVQLCEISMTDEQREQILQMSQFDNAAKRIAQIDEELRKIQSSIDFLTQHAPKGKAKPSKREITFDSFVNPETYKGVWEKVFEANRLQKTLAAKKSELGSLINDHDALILWKKLELPVELKGTASTEIINGTVPPSADIDLFLKALDEIGCVFINIIASDSNQSYVSLIFHKSVSDKVNEQLRLVGFTRANFGEISGLVAENIKNLDNRISQIRQDIADISEQSEQRYNDLYEIEGLYDYIFNMRERRVVRENFLKTDKAFVVGGWTPADVAQKVKKEIEGDFTVFVDITQPEAGEETPVLLKNNRFIYPFEIITDMYSLPSSSGVDPNFVMAPFYWFFFGIMLSDGGYGALLSLLCGFAVWKLKTEKGSILDKMLKMLFFCGISTVIWGAAFGGWFGDLSLVVFGREIAPLWFNPAGDPMKLMIWAFIFGAFQLIVGMAMNAYILIRNGKWLDAVFDIGFWYVVFAGLVIMFFGGDLSYMGKYIAAAGGIGLILTQGRSEKHIVKKFLSGALSLYNITGFMSDVLSYSRLLALGLATGVIAQVINQVAVLPGGFGSIVSTIIMFVILTGGHIFNMAINTLGAYVHSSRLQYVEFFGKFYEGGGKAFAPIRAKVKYLRIKPLQLGGNNQ
ncbi:MAG: V-type ATP synthase subunit I [Firmicutes bacterium ADurb.Bin193]|nr:MAG: V-type ATP synthase subunit I [Firmicutes bacterium ADurb.Bin193]